MRVGAALLLLAAAVLAGPGGKKYLVIELRNGQKVIAEVLEAECTDDALVVRQIRPPKKMTIPWEEVKEAQAHELRVELGFEAAETAPEAMLMQGHRIRNKAGTVFAGLWTNPDTAKKEGLYILKTAEGERRIRLSDVAAEPEPVQLNKLEVYTPRELYEQKLAEKPPQTAEDHYRIAEFCFAIDALEEAKLHYEKVLELDDPKYSRDKIERNLARVQRLIDKSEARNELKEIKRSIVYKRFDKGREQIAAFKEKYVEEADFMAQVEALAKELEKERDQYYVSNVPREIRETVEDLLEVRVREDKELGIRDAMRFAGGEPKNEDSVSRHAIEKVAEELSLTPEEVLQYWNDRPRRNIYKAFYRDGTFIVIDDLEDALRNVSQPKGGGKDGPQPPKPTPRVKAEDWWEAKKEARKFTDLGDWLFAYWAEKSGMCEVLEPKEELCPTCYGKGYTVKMYTTSQGSVPFYNRCQTCYMARHFRVVRFK